MSNTIVFIETLAISGIQPIIMFCLVVTLCENGGTPKVMVRSKDIFVPHVIPYLIYEANCTKVSKVQPKSWHVAMTKLHDLLARPTIDQTNVLFRVVVVHNEGVVQLKGASTQWYIAFRVLLNFGIQPLMLGKAVVDGIGLIIADLDPCLYHI